LGLKGKGKHLRECEGLKKAPKQILVFFFFKKKIKKRRMDGCKTNQVFSSQDVGGGADLGNLLLQGDNLLMVFFSFLFLAAGFSSYYQTN
jgi:hypothetical protein